VLFGQVKEVCILQWDEIHFEAANFFLNFYFGHIKVLFAFLQKITSFPEKAKARYCTPLRNKLLCQLFRALR
jgi:hypothetical protein